MKRYTTLLFAFMVLGFTACTNLDLQPLSSVTSAQVFDDPGAYPAFIAKLYAGLATSGQQGPAGDGDIKGIDEGFSSYMRQYWKAQQLPTDEAVIGWGDEGLPDYHNHSWTASNQFVTAMYNRIFIQVSLANEFLRETTDEKLNERAVTDELRADIQGFRAEARFLRALSYWHGIDMFGDIPFYTEADGLGTEGPDQASRSEVYDFLVSELQALTPNLPAAGAAEYGRADQAAANTLLAKLYLNAEVYTGTANWNGVITATEAVISASAYSLAPDYRHNFTADNHLSPEIIFPVVFDGLRTQTWGGMTFLAHASVGGNMDPGAYGIDGGWWGLRATSALVDLFPDVTGDADGRSIFYTDGHTKEITNVGDFFSGYPAPKFTNLASDGTPGANATFPDIDYPLFRLADVYLMYAEATVQGGNGNTATAVGYVNELRQRAYGDNSGDISSADLTVDFIKDERARELYWEGHRRTDLIRFGQFSDQGVWPWKGGVEAGTTTSAHLDLFPIPSSDRLANPKLQQNPGY